MSQVDRDLFAAVEDIDPAAASRAARRQSFEQETSFASVGGAAYAQSRSRDLPQQPYRAPSVSFQGGAAAIMEEPLSQPVAAIAR